MKMPSAVLVAAVTLTSSWAFAQGGGELNLINLTNLDELSQLAHFQEVEGGCRFYGELNKASGDVQIEVKACPTEDGNLYATPFEATIKLGALPVPAGTRFNFKQ